MPVHWIDVTNLPFDAMLLLERAQLSWLPGWAPEPELGIALRANPAVEWFMRHKCPPLAGWLDEVLARAPRADAGEVRRAELGVLAVLNDLITYALDPALYDAQPFLQWDTRELADVADFTGRTVLDIGAGTGRLTFIAAERAAAVFAVEPAGNLRHYIMDRARARGFGNVYAVDGLIEAIPFPDRFADICMGGHVFGGRPAAELCELERVTKAGGMVVLCPGNVDCDNEQHAVLVGGGYAWARFTEPGDGTKRKYWKTI